jgi:hypothetical protein
MPTFLSQRCAIVSLRREDLVNSKMLLLQPLICVRACGLTSPHLFILSRYGRLSEQLEFHFIGPTLVRFSAAAESTCGCPLQDVVAPTITAYYSRI